MDRVITSTNAVNNLETDLMPFLQKKPVTNFPIDHDFPWISDATIALDELIMANVDGPNKLLEQFKEYEYIPNVNEKQLIKDLFKGGENGGKKPINEIKEQILHYEKAYYEIMTLSEDEVDYKIFRVMTKKLKQTLGDEAKKLMDKILDETYKYCTDTVSDVYKTYVDMQNKIMHDPQNERELIATKDFIAIAPAKDEELKEILKEVYAHYLMLEEFSYMYKESDIEAYWFMKVWPLRIQACLTDGKNMITEKNESFGARLENEKEAFLKQITTFQNNFEKIKEFNNLDQCNHIIKDSLMLKKELEKAE